jgi:tRNA nucleotidyltransferase/poly(A) polymerase
MREEAPAVKLVSGERIGGGLAADGMGELSKLLLGAEPARALRLARDTGVLVELLPEFGPAIGFNQESRYHDLTVDEHTLAVVQAAADQGFSLAVRLAALFHDLGKPVVAWRGNDGRLHYYAKPGFAVHGHDRVGADLANQALLRLRYPNALRKRVVRIVRRHMFQPGKGDARRARRFLRRNGDQLASTSSTTSTPTCSASAAAKASRRRWRRSSGSRASVRWWNRSCPARTGCAISRSTATT